MKWLAGVLLAVAGTAALGGASATGNAAAGPALQTWLPNGSVYAVAKLGNRIYIGGAFNRVGPPTGSGVALDPATGAADAHFETIDGVVRTAVPDGSGGWFVGGDLSHVGAVSQARLAHLLQSGAVDSRWHPRVAGGRFGAEVRTLALAGRSLYVGGDFVAIDGKPRSSLARLDAVTGAVDAWRPRLTVDLSQNGLNSLLVTGRALYVGGDFSAGAGGVHDDLVAFDTQTASTLSWGPELKGLQSESRPGGRPGAVYALALGGSRLFVAGDFKTVDGVDRPGLVALAAATGRLDSAWRASICCRGAERLQVSGGLLYLAGRIRSLGGKKRDGVGAVDLRTGSVAAWSPRLAGGSETRPVVHTLEIIGGKVYLGGDFSAVQGERRSNLAAVDAKTAVLTAWDPGANAPVDVLVAGGSKLYAGGIFSSIGGNQRVGIAALDATTGRLDPAWDARADGPVRALAVGGSRLYLGGSFTKVGGAPRSRLAAVDSASSALDAAWNPGVDGAVRALAVSGARILVGGDFHAVHGVPRRSLAAVDSVSGAVDAQWRADVEGAVHALLPVGETIFVGGAFTTVAGASRTALAAVSAAGTLLPWTVGGLDDRDSDVRALVSNGALYAAGKFIVRGPENTFRAFDVAPLDRATGAVLASWRLIKPTPLQGSAFALALGPNRLYVGGGFFVPLGGDRFQTGTMAANPQTGVLDRSWPHSTDAIETQPVNALLLDGSRLYAAGAFTMVDDRTLAYFTVLPA